MHLFEGKRILVTGGTGSFGNAFVRRLLDNYELNVLSSIPATNLSSIP